MIDITMFFIVNKAQYDMILSNLNVETSDYYMGLILSNIFAYLIILMFLISIFYVIKRIRKMIRRSFN